ncbi:MAG: GIY-YIG nuclease superfamily protein [Candidatus Omnitrophica bacterium ADurb.Bin277]|nr:MAG: GIY-YIG nuclease superfamily protein [Candidatus Omnitrophica bacterium ADurb.Bin277]
MRKIKRKACFHVYILRCKNGAYYTGFTNNLARRFEEHSKGRGAKYLRGKGPLELVYAKKYAYFLTAMRAERDVKRMSRKKKDELVAEYAVKSLRAKRASAGKPRQKRR